MGVSATFDYEPEIVGGQVIERGVPTKEHSRMQRFLIIALQSLKAYEVFPELTITLNGGNRRIPDVALFRADDQEIPFLYVEIVSPDDKVIVLMEKIREYIESGVEFVWGHRCGHQAR